MGSSAEADKRVALTKEYFNKGDTGDPTRRANIELIGARISTLQVGAKHATFVRRGIVMPSTWRQKLKRKLNWDAKTPEERQRLLEKALPPMRAVASVAGTFRADMRLLSMLSMTDKFGYHDYVPAYARHFAPLRNKPIRLLEIGVGGYSESDGGRSLVLWNSYFKHARIAALDIHDKTFLSRGRIKVFQGSQVDPVVLKSLIKEYGGFDVIIDDGSHINEHLIESFRLLFPALSAGGIYVMEDLETAYLPEYGGGPIGSVAYEASSMNFLRSLIDGVNVKLADGAIVASQNEFAANISSMHFYEEICFIYKRA